MSFRRYEVILPTRYNDGSPVERDKYFLTLREIRTQFGAASFLPQNIHGTWMHAGQLYEETNVRLFVDVEDTPESTAFFARHKEVLKARFRQIDIWIVSYEIRIT